MQNLQELPKFGDKLSYLYVEHAAIDQSDKSIAIHQADGGANVPAASLALLMLGPGTTVTHAAVRALADNNCQVIWAGEQGVRFYAHGLGGARHSRNLIRQARLVSNELTRLAVVVRMYMLRFDEPVDETLTLQQLRGMEGIRVRQAYAEASKAHGVPWQGRSYKRDQWDAADPVNRALSCANACLYGLSYAAIISAGYSPALGFIHTGKDLSFVYDVADLYKAEITIPLAFSVVAEGTAELERRVRIACRDIFRRTQLMERILPDLAAVLDVPEDRAAAVDEFAADASLPAELWDPAAFAPDTPVGKILKLEQLSTKRPLRKNKEQHNDSADRGTGDSISAG